jgi:hypothetical protein
VDLLPFWYENDVAFSDFLSWFRKLVEMEMEADDVRQGRVEQEILPKKPPNVEKIKQILSC